MNNNYGIPRDIYARIKYGTVLLRDLFLIVATPFIIFTFQQSIFPPNALFHLVAFPLLSTVMVIYLLLPANGGKKNFNLLWLNFRSHRYFWISFQKGAE